MKQKIAQLIASELKIDISKIEVLKSKSEKNGDYYTNLGMVMAAELSMNPIEQADILADKISAIKEFDKVEVAGPGFINIYINKNYIFDTALKYFDPTYKPTFDNIEKEKIDYEFVSANPTGYLHVGHARNAIVGDITVKILRYIGHEVGTDYWINDAGNQVLTLSQSVYFYIAQANNLECSMTIDEIGYKGIEIKEFANELAKLEVYKNISEKDAMEKVKKIAIEHYLDIIKKTLVSMNVEVMDNWESEQKIIDSGLVQKSISDLRERGALYEKDGATWMKSTQFGDDKDRVLIKSDGKYTYLTADIANHVKKFTRGFEKLINTWGTDHHSYETRVRASIQHLGFPGEALEIDFISMVQIISNNKKVKMSKRAGTSLWASKLVDILGVDLLRYFIISRAKQQNLTIDLEAINKKDMNNPYYYCQYAFARLHQLLDKNDSKIVFSKSLKRLGEAPKEIKLARKMNDFVDVIELLNKTREPATLLNYLKELAADFHSFYNSCYVLTEDKELTNERLLLMLSLKNLLTQIFKLLGIKPMDKM